MSDLFYLLRDREYDLLSKKIQLLLAYTKEPNKHKNKSQIRAERIIYMHGNLVPFTVGTPSKTFNWPHVSCNDIYWHWWHLIQTHLKTSALVVLFPAQNMSFLVTELEITFWSCTKQTGIYGLQTFFIWLLLFNVLSFSHLRLLLKITVFFFSLVIVNDKVDVS